MIGISGNSRVMIYDNDVYDSYEEHRKTLILSRSITMILVLTLFEREKNMVIACIRCQIGIVRNPEYHGCKLDTVPSPLSSDPARAMYCSS